MNSVFFQPADDNGRRMMTEYIESEHGKVERQRIGSSIMGRDIDAYIIGKGQGRVAFFGGYHASESITCNLLFAFTEALLSGKAWGRYDALTILSAFTFVIVPMVNPDGAEMRIRGIDQAAPLAARQMAMCRGDASHWQANARGVDLNHNHDHRFTEYKELERRLGISPGATLYSGEYPESEPESRAAAALVRALAPMGVVSLHSQGEVIYPHPSTEKSLRVAERMREASGYGISVPDGTAEYGGLCDYTGDLGIPSFTVEVGIGENPLPESVLDRVFSSVAPMLFAFPTFL